MRFGCRFQRSWSVSRERGGCHPGNIAFHKAPKCVQHNLTCYGLSVDVLSPDASSPGTLQVLE
jgi:hypothetical protein